MASGLLIDEIPRERNESSRTYTGTGEQGGHLPLPEARRWSLERVEGFEAEVEAAHARVAETAKQLTAAQKEYDAASSDLHRLRAQLASAREDLIWRCGGGPRARSQQTVDNEAPA